MGIPQLRLEDIAAQVADGRPVDWAAAESSVDAVDADALKELRVLAEVLALHRGRAAPPEDPASASVTTSDDAETIVTGLGTWGTLKLLEEVGRGAFGVVYRAWDPALEREVALKLIERSVRDPEMAARVLREGRLLAKIRHPNVVTVHGAQQIGDQVGLWMEFVRGRTLADIVERDGPYAPDEATRIGAEVCRAVAAVHAAGLVHRDIKARNVMRESGGRIVLMDFGTGRELEEPADPRHHEIAGTPLYMAPEVLLGEAATRASDIYSLGVLLFHLVTGRFPVSGRTLDDIRLAHARSQRVPLGDLKPELSDRFVGCVERALAPRTADRYQTARAMRVELLQRPAARPRPAVRAAPELGTRPIRRPWHLLGAALLVVFGLEVLGFLTSMAFNVSLGRPMGFANESVGMWFIWGVRSLIPPAVYILLAVTLYTLVSVLWGFATRLSEPVRRLSDRVRVRVGRLSTRLGLEDVNARAQGLFVIGFVAFVAVCWRFSDLIGAFFTPISEVPSEQIRPLSYANIDDQILYGRVLDMLLLVSSIAWYRVLRTRRRLGIRDNLAPVAGGLAVTVLFLLMWVVPWRLLFNNQFERVSLEAQRCYIIGQRADEYLIHCADADPPKNRLIRTDDPRLHRDGVHESIFTPLVQGRVQ